MVTVKTGIDVDIGANPSAEEQDEALEEGEERVNQIVQTFRLQQTSFDKKTYMTYLRVRTQPIFIIFYSFIDDVTARSLISKNSASIWRTARRFRLPLRTM
jgi:hypothetical protein